jgi:type VI secretion system secreted protein Hcp
MRKVARIALPATAALGAGAAFAVAAIPAGDGTINGCYDTSTGTRGLPGDLRLVDSPNDCQGSEKAISWNQKGAAGPQGSQGPAGANGVNGQNGAGGALGGAVFPRAATDYYLEIDGIKGESTDAKHASAIDIESFSWGVTHKSSGGGGGGGGAGKVKFHDISVKKPVDAASPKLFLACATGQHLKKAVLYVRKAGGNGTQLEYLKVTLTDVLVSSYKVGSQEPKGPGEVESVSFNFAKIEEQYLPVGANGQPGPPVKAGYDSKANKAV